MRDGAAGGVGEEMRWEGGRFLQVPDLQILYYTDAVEAGEHPIDCRLKKLAERAFSPTAVVVPSLEYEMEPHGLVAVPCRWTDLLRGRFRPKLEGG